jgi:hypothetical protein
VSSGLPHSANKPGSNNSMVPLWKEWACLKLTKAQRVLLSVNESPFYTWHVSEFSPSFYQNLLVINLNLPSPSVLDLRIMYKRLKSNFASDWSLVADLDCAKEKLKYFYRLNYANRTRPSPLQSSQSISESAISSRSGGSRGSPEKINFTTRYKKDRVVVDRKIPIPENPTSGGLKGAHRFLICTRPVCESSQFLVSFFFMISAAADISPYTYGPAPLRYSGHPDLFLIIMIITGSAE